MASLGPGMETRHWVSKAVAAIEEWADRYPPFQSHPSVAVDDERFALAFERFVARLANNYPFFHPSYAGQMLKPPHPAAVVGYLAAMLINPNNHALDGGPATAAMEIEVIADLAGMFGFAEHLGHLTTSGTIANLEALFVARESHPTRGIAYSAESHFTHARMCALLGVEAHSVGVDRVGRMDLVALEDLLRGGRIGTVVVTAGTTGLGAVDPIADVVPLARRYGARIHVDAAYGGFFRLLASDARASDARASDPRASDPSAFEACNATDATAFEAGPESIEPAPWLAIADCDSVVVDPHKHGLQPYGCGAVLFADPRVGRFYQHDSPYTYFTSDALHLGEISLECSRAGAAAAALWLTFQVLPPTPAGLGAVLAAGRRAALRWADLIGRSEVLELYQAPELDIVTYFPATSDGRLSQVDAAAAEVLAAGMADPEDPVFLSLLNVNAAAFELRQPDVVADARSARILRSVLMKPEEETYVDTLHARVEALAAARSSR